MKNTILACFLASAASVANAQSLPGSIPPGFEIGGEVGFSYAFDGFGGSESVTFGYLDLGYRHEVSADLAIGVGLRGIGFLFESVDELSANFYAYAEFQNFRLTYGATDNAANHFDSDYVRFENHYFQLDGYGLGPIGNHPEFLTLTDIIRVDAQLGQFNLSASYSNEAEVAAVGLQTQFGNTNVIALYEWEAPGDNWLASLAVEHSIGAIDLAAYVGIPDASAPFDYIARIGATYHLNDAISLKAIYAPSGVFADNTYEVSATYQVNEMFSLGASVGNLGSDTVFGLNANAEF